MAFKKLLFLFVGLLGVAGLLASAVPANAQIKKPTRLQLIGGSTGGSWYAYLAGMVPIYKRYGITVAVEPGGGAVNPLRISKAEGDAAFGQTSANFDAKEGKNAFKKYGKITNIHNLLMVGTDHIHLACSKDSGITTWAGIKGARLGAPAKSQASWFNFLTGAMVVGLKESDLNIVSRGGATTGAKMVKDRQADCVTHTSHYPIASFSELAIARPVTIIGMTDAQIAEVTKQNAGLVPGVIPAGAYKGHDKDVKAYLAGSVLMTHSKLSKDKGYWITKVIGDNLPEIRKIHKGISRITLEIMAAAPAFPLNEGALMYYKEKGLK